VLSSLEAISFLVQDLELEEQLTALSSPPPGSGIYFNFSCRARGHALFGEDGSEARKIANSFAYISISGAIGSCQFAPLAPGGPAELLTYAGALALVDP
jgi:small ligand-binding sensory domain FIST